VADLRKKLEKGGFEVKTSTGMKSITSMDWRFSVRTEERTAHQNQFKPHRLVEYRNLVQLHQEIREIAPPPYLLIQNGKEVPSTKRKPCSIHQSIRKGRAFHPEVQRIGEMNPETTLADHHESETRTLLKVRVEDAVEAMKPSASSWEMKWSSGAASLRRMPHRPEPRYLTQGAAF